MTKNCNWTGVFPAVTTQFKDDSRFSIDLEATAAVVERLIGDGVSGLIMCGTVGEGTSLTRAEKAALYEMAISTARGRVPVIGGIAETTAAFAIETAREAERLRLDGIMLMPPLVYSSRFDETVAHYRAVGTAIDVAMMVYNNPPAYGTDVTPPMLVQLADVETIVCFKESSGDTRRFIDLRNMVGDRYRLFAGLDDVVMESILVGAQGWVSGVSNAFPREGETLFRLAIQGRYAEALPLYQWFMPLLHLDARPDLVQCIKLCEYLVGRGSFMTRPPRLPLGGEARAAVEKTMAAALANRPMLPDVGIPGAAS